MCTKHLREIEREKYEYQGQRNGNKNEDLAFYISPSAIPCWYLVVSNGLEKPPFPPLPQTFPRVHATETSFRFQLPRPCFFFSPPSPGETLSGKAAGKVEMDADFHCESTRRPLVDPRFVFLNFNPFRHL